MLQDLRVSIVMKIPGDRPPIYLEGACNTGLTQTKGNIEAPVTLQ